MINFNEKILVWTFVLIIFLLVFWYWSFILNGDLSGKVYPVSKVNVGKVGDILEKQVNNDTSVYHQKIKPES